MGFWIRETGQALDRLGCRLQGNSYFQEQLSRHRTLMNIFDKAPMVDKNAFVAPSASIIGDVQVVRGSSVWYGCVLRGDVNGITVGSGTNIQDNSLVHVPKSNISGKVLPTIIGDNVTVGMLSFHYYYKIYKLGVIYYVYWTSSSKKFLFLLLTSFLE